MDSWKQHIEITAPESNKVSRHVMISTAQGVITELELTDAVCADGYVIRQRNASGGVGQVMDSGSWIGFRYHDAHWSFVKQ